MDLSRLQTMRELLTEQLTILEQMCGEAEKADGHSDAMAGAAVSNAGQTNVHESSKKEGRADAIKRTITSEDVNSKSTFRSSASVQFADADQPYWQDLSQPLVCNSTSDLEHSRRNRSIDAERYHLRQKRKRQRLHDKVVELRNTDQRATEEVDLYKDYGFASDLVQNDGFRFLAGVMILANAIWVGFETDYGPDSSILPLAFKVLNSVFCLFFVFEVVMRYFAFERTQDAAKAPTFIFDALVVADMIWESWICPLWYFWSGKHLVVNIINFAALRIIRVARLGRLLKFKRDAPELMLYAQGLWKGLKDTFPLLILLLLLGYAVAIVLVQILWQTELGKEHFGTVLEGCHFLFFTALASIRVDIFEQMLQAGWFSWVIFSSFMVVGNLTVSKMLTGVLVQVVQSLVSKEKEKAETRALEQNIARIAIEILKTESGSLSLAEFNEMMDLEKHPELIQSMYDHGVDIAGFVEHTRAAFPKAGEMQVDDVIDMAKKFCGSKPATVKDMEYVRRFVSTELELIRVELKKDIELTGRMMEAISVNQSKLDFLCTEGYHVSTM